MAEYISPNALASGSGGSAAPSSVATSSAATFSAVDGDNWQWLEEPRADKCLAWSKQETELTQKYLDSLPRTSQLQEKLDALLKKNEPPPSYAIHQRLFRFRHDAVRKQGILEVSDLDSPDEWKTVVDIDELGRREGKTWQLSTWTMGSIGSFIMPNSSRMLLLLSEGGADEVSLREFDIEKGESVPNGFQTGAGLLSVAWLDSDHILISHALDGGPKCSTGWPTRSYIWKRGTALQEAKHVHSAKPGETIVTSTGIGHGETRRGLIQRAITFAKIAYYTVSLDGTVEEVDLPQDLDMDVAPAATDRHVVLRTTEPSTVGGKEIRRGALVAWDYVGGENRSTVVYAPENDDEVVSGIGATKASRSKVYFTTLKRTTERQRGMEFVDGEWKLVRSIDTLSGTSASIKDGDLFSDAVIVESTGLLTPTSLRLNYGADRGTNDLFSQEAAFDHDKYEVKTEVANSKDGTEIDYFLLSPKNAKPELPLLMTGYGAFNISFGMGYLTPWVGGLSLVPWLESGGALVIPWIRGGGERGESWHQKALREKRQNSYDDFAAVAEKLISDGVSTPRHMGVFGASNGGLLAGVMGTQRPDLYNAIVSDVPLIDMLRFPYIGMGAAWINEYGDPKDPEMAKVLRAYSPFHNIKAGVQYPAFLSTCSTLDDRVGAGHGRKLVAKLKEVNSPKAFLYEEGVGGHGVSDPYKSSALMARRISFLIEHLQ